jgi:predicted HAD superfamily Cof-like phosphohydrolase
VRLIEEELEEFREAVAKSDVVEMIDALCDLLYVTYGAAVALGVDIDPFFDEVHRANMAKRGAGQRHDGKQLKPVDWKAPRIAELLESIYRSAR